MRGPGTRRLTIGLAALLMGATACGFWGRSAPAPSGTTPVSVYFVRDGRLAVAHRSVTGSASPTELALRALLAGPGAAESAAGMDTAIPAGTRLLSLRIAQGLATVDLSSEFGGAGGSLPLASRLAQVAFTATQFPIARQVVFRLAGRSSWLLGGQVPVGDQPVSRDAYEALLPAIMVESPGLGDEVTSPIDVWGTAAVPGGRLDVQLVNAAGAVLTDQAVQAASSDGTRAGFAASLSFTAAAGEGALVAFAESADGAPIDEVRTPVRISGSGPEASPGPPEVVPSATPSPSPAAQQAEWQRNLRPSHQSFALHRAVALVNMETGQIVAQVGPDTITVDYETSAGGQAYWMTQYSVARGLPNGLAKSEVAAAVAAPPQSGTAVPPSLAGAEWTRLPTTRPVVALTFDSGGNSAGVASILATLQREGVPGTFFMTGRWAEVYPDLARRIAAAYPVGNHTYSHPHLTTLGDSQVLAEIRGGEAAIETATGRDPHPLFRFPYGESDGRTLGLVHQEGYGGIRWTVDTLGWKGASAGQSAGTVVSRVLASLQPGEIVLMHVGGAEDGTTLDADALPQVIAAVRARGYSFVTVESLV